MSHLSLVAPWSAQAVGQVLAMRVLVLRQVEPRQAAAEPQAPAHLMTHRILPEPLIVAVAVVGALPEQVLLPDALAAPASSSSATR